MMLARMERKSDSQSARLLNNTIGAICSIAELRVRYDDPDIVGVSMQSERSESSNRHVLGEDDFDSKFTLSARRPCNNPAFRHVPEQLSGKVVLETFRSNLNHLLRS